MVIVQCDGCGAQHQNPPVRDGRHQPPKGWKSVTVNIHQSGWSPDETGFTLCGNCEFTVSINEPAPKRCCIGHHQSSAGS